MGLSWISPSANKPSQIFGCIVPPKIIGLCTSICGNGSLHNIVQVLGSDLGFDTNSQTYFPFFPAFSLPWEYFFPLAQQPGDYRGTPLFNTKNKIRYSHLLKHMVMQDNDLLALHPAFLSKNSK